MARGLVIMAENFELLEIGQIELMHEQTHDQLSAENADCDMLRQQHDSLAAELVKRGVAHDTEIVCPEIETDAPNYRRGFTDDICTHCAFGQLFPFCNLYKFEYLKGFTCDSFRYFEILELEPPHGFLMAQGKQTALAVGNVQKKVDRPFLVVSNGEVFGIAEFDGEPAQIKTKEFDSEGWLNQHRITPRERRQWWPGAENFYVYRLKNWYPYEGIKLYENGKVIDEPKLTAKQWQLVSAAKELPKQIMLVEEAVSVTDKQEFIINLPIDCKELDSILSATYQIDVKKAKTSDELISLYSLALVRNPRMRVSKKSLVEAETKQEDEIMPYEIEERDNEFCVVKTEDNESVGCHETREEAEAQLTALRINVEAEEGEAAIHTDKPRKRKPRKKEIEDLDQVVQTEPEKVKKAGFMENLRSLGKSISDFLKLAETEENEVKLFVSRVGIGQKVVNGEVWHFTYSTNAFEDRDGEMFSTKGLEDYVTANEANEDKGFFNLWHINEEDGNFNTDFAVKRWQGVVGRFLVEAGPYLNDEKGQAAKEFFKKFGDRHPEIAPEGWGCSPEFRYLPEERANRTYDTFWINRTSTLPKFSAANIWTETRQFKNGGLKMALSEDQKQAAIEMFGDDFVATMMQEAEEKTAELETAGVAHKSSEAETEQPEPQQVNINIEELAAEVGKQFQADLTPVAEAMAAMATELSELKEWKEKQEKEQDVKNKAEMPRFVFNLQRASETESTIVTEDDGLKNAKPKEAQGKGSDPWSQVFDK